MCLTDSMEFRIYDKHMKLKENNIWNNIMDIR